MDEFEEEPVILGRRSKKKEPPVKTLPVEDTEIIAEDEDDDLEFLDLNDL